MLGKKKFEPKLMYNLTIDDLVPSDNFYRVLDDLLDLRFVYQHCKSLYGRTGNPSIDPVVFFKLNLFGFFENITSDRELLRRAGDTISVRYYLGYDIDEKLPWHSTISRTRAIIKKETFEMVFNKIVEKCNQSGLIEGKHQSIDSTLVKANASLESLERKYPKLGVEEFVDRLYQENDSEVNEEDNNSDSQNKPDQKIERNNQQTDKKLNRSERNKYYYSKTDPDSRIKSKPGKPSGLYYSTHYSADSKNKVITDVLTTYADINDSTVLLEVYQRAEKRLKKLGLSIAEISADKGYCSGRNLREMDNRAIEAFIPTQKHKNTTGNMNREQFSYNAEENLYTCPNNKKLEYHTYEKGRERYRYLAKKEDCSNCPLKINCCPDTERRSISRTIYYEEYQKLSRRLKTPEARRAYIIRKTVSEGLFAEAKMNHGLSKFMTRGIDKAQKSSYLIASVQNLKRLVKDTTRKVGKAALMKKDKLNEKLLNLSEILSPFTLEVNLKN